MALNHCCRTQIGGTATSITYAPACVTRSKPSPAQDRRTARPSTPRNSTQQKPSSGKRSSKSSDKPREKNGRRSKPSARTRSRNVEKRYENFANWRSKWSVRNSSRSRKSVIGNASWRRGNENGMPSTPPFARRSMGTPRRCNAMWRS